MMLALCALLAAAPASDLPRGPVSFTADQVTMDPRARSAILDGRVNLKRGDLLVTGDHATADLAPPATNSGVAGAAQAGSPRQVKRARGQASAARASQAGSGPGLNSQELRRFTVDGHVHVEREGRTADGAHAEYDGDAQTLLLTGPSGSPSGPAGAVSGAGALRTPPPPPAGPVLRDGAESLTGERILLHLGSDQVDVTRPRLVLHRSEDAAGSPTPRREGKSRPAVPVRVEAQRLQLDSNRRVARFSDDVVIHRGEVTVRGPRMDARYDKQGDLTTLDLSGGVELRQGDRRATGRKATYDAATRQLILTGSPRLYDRGDQLTGERIEMALDSHEVKVDRARGRLRPEQHQGEEQAP